MFSRNNQARMEKNQQRIDAGYLSHRYPEVASIIISMMYKQKGVLKPIHRVINFSPGSYAFFRLDCLSRDCVDGGFDLSQTINSMVRNRSEAGKGELSCDDSGPRLDHSSIVYEVAIQYT